MEEEVFSVTTTSPRKMKFQPKVPVRKTPKAVETKKELLSDAEASKARELLRRVNESSMRRGAKVERKSEPAQVAFGLVGNSLSVRTFGKKSSSSGSTSRIQGPVSDDSQILPVPKKIKDYVAPWNYDSYYPVTLPLRRPHSGNPELLDEEEFADEASENGEYNANSTSPAAELGLMEDSEDERTFFLQLPASLPMAKRPPSIKGKEIAGSSRSSGLSEKENGLDQLPPGFLGKMQVYKSGAIKMKLGEVVYDVSPGSDCVFAQNVVAINIKERHCCDLGELDKLLVMTPNIDSILKQ